MSSASSGRYQSRLFNFVHKQSRRLTERCERAFRELQVATSWVAPVVLYPIYLLFRSTRAAVKQVHQSVQKNWPQLQADNTDSQPQTPPTVDTPIQRVLLLVDALPLSGARSQESGVRELLAASRHHAITPSRHHAITPSPPNRNRRVVRGIATQLSSRTLVLVTAENEILDILTTQQQQKLQEQIIGEVADYWRYQRLAHSAPLHLPTNQDLPYESDRTRATGVEIISPFAHPPILSYPYQALAVFDRAVAELESNYLAPVSEAAIAFGKSSWQLVQQVQTQLFQSLIGIHSEPPPPPSIYHHIRVRGMYFTQMGTGVTVSRKSPAITADVSDTHTFRIQALIWAAVNHFFGYRGGRQLKQTTSATNSLDLPGDSKPRRMPLPHSRSASKLPTSFESSGLQSIGADEDPWLTLGDLFGEPESSLALERDRCGEIPHQPSSQSTHLEPAPSWIEARATTMGYVKHPLEQLLEWLDRAWVWLEDVLMIVWGRVQQLWRGK